MKRIQKKYGLLIIGILLGIVYGLVTRLLFGREATLASITYLFIIPTILGIIPLLFTDEEKLKSYRNIIFIPWITVTAFFLSLFVFGIEDILCLFILALPFFVLGTIGALLFRIAAINDKNRKRKILAIALLPFLFAPIEEFIKSPSEIYSVKREVIINASPETIWNNIVSVEIIQQHEYDAGFFNSIGIPRPLSATVDRKQIGGKRIGNFEGGLTFIETITDYQENKKVSFSIHIDPKTIREKVFDQHVLKGNYFTFVDATYELTQLPNGQVKLSLSSSYQLTSKINAYGSFWGSILLSDFQDRLLDVIKKRCEQKQSNKQLN